MAARDPDDPAIGNVADPCAADDGGDMVLAMAFETDAAQHDHLVIAVDLFEGLFEDLLGILVIAAEIFAKRPHEALGRLMEAVAIGILAVGFNRRYGMLTAGAAPELESTELPVPRTTS